MRMWQSVCQPVTLRQCCPTIPSYLCTTVLRNPLFPGMIHAVAHSRDSNERALVQSPLANARGPQCLQRLTTVNFVVDCTKVYIHENSSVLAGGVRHSRPCGRTCSIKSSLFSQAEVLFDR